ncbi:unnamed protein product [Brassica oleracea]
MISTVSHLPYNRNGFKFFFIFKHFFWSAAVDSSGHEFNRNRLIALLSAIVLEQIRVSGFGGWLILSLHDPVLPLNIE